MRRWALDHLACPETGERLELVAEQVSGEDIQSGTLVAPGGKRYPIVSGIPRFVPEASYCDSFGLQWNRYSRLRSDHHNGTHLIRDTLRHRFGWSPDHLRGKTVLECGSGCGNDTEVLLQHGAERVIAFDLSTAVDAAVRAVASDRVQFVQADILHVPARTEAFDVVYCHRVIQHTPDPEAAFRSIARHLAPAGELDLHSYDSHWRSMLHFKYVLRPLTSRLPPEQLLAAMERAGRLLYPLQGAQIRLFRRIKLLRSLANKIIPFYNYAHIYRDAGTTLTDEELYQVSLLDTFDALSPTYDLPSSAATVQRWFADAGLSARLTRRNPIVVVGIKDEAQLAAS